MNAYIRSVGVHRPAEIVSNVDLEKTVDTTDEWIRSRSGIEARRIERDLNVKTSDLAVSAALDALKKAGIGPEEIDGIILGTLVPDHVLPATACIVQKKLGAVNAFAYDITAACSFVPIALNTASLMIRAGQAKNILLIGSELMSRTVNWKDRNTCVLFGDGAGAILVSATEDPNRGFVDAFLKSDGSADHILYMPRPDEPESYLHMDGKAVFKMAVTEMAASVRKTLDRAGMTVDQVDLLVPHQANIRIMDSTADRLGIPKEKVVCNVQQYGNTSSASIPIALSEAIDQGKLKPGMVVVFVAIGAGMTWGCNIVRW